MHLKLGSIALLSALFIGATTTAAQAQNFQNWLQNAASQIQQDSSSGLLNANQASQLQNREAQIQAQQQQYLNQNGGVLTPQQSSKISSELRRLNQRVSNDVRNNNPAINSYNNGWVPSTVPTTPWQSWRNNNWSNSTYAPNNAYTPNNTSWWQSQYRNRRHHHFFQN